MCSMTNPRNVLAVKVQISCRSTKTVRRFAKTNHAGVRLVLAQIKCHGEQLSSNPSRGVRDYRFGRKSATPHLPNSSVAIQAAKFVMLSHIFCPKWLRASGYQFMLRVWENFFDDQTLSFGYFTFLNIRNMRHAEPFPSGNERPDYTGRSDV